MMKTMSLIGKILPEQLRYQAWCWKKYFQEPEIRAAARIARARPGMRCIDVGANGGVYSYFMKRAGAKVEAFEPIPVLAQDIQRRFGGSIAVHQVALSDQNGNAELHIPIIDGQLQYGYASCENEWDQGQQKKIAVETRTLDSYNLKDVGLIKIDVEGYELAVLEGALETITTSRPTLIIEAEERHRKNAVTSIAELLRKYGYQGTFIKNGVEHPLNNFRQERDQARPEAKGYVCNFIFAPSALEF